MNKSSLFKLVFSIFIAITACKGNKDNILPIDKMKVVFLQQIMADEMVSNYFASRDTSLKIDSLYIVSFDNVLKLNGTDSASFFQSLAYYKSDPQLFKELLDSTYAYADRLRQSLYEKQDTPEEETEKSAEENDSGIPVDKDSTMNSIDSTVNAKDSLVN
jgi:hypothetical protein